MVVDASTVVEVLLRTDKGVLALRVLRGEPWVAPHLIDAEALQSLRRLARQGVLSEERADVAVQRLSRLPLERVDVSARTQEVWSLRHNVAAYDASYVVLARALEAALVTADGRLSRASNLGVPVIAV